eukprot:scaffold44284_cov86-Phaeocystis_antarctica.AAC.1
MRARPASPAAGSRWPMLALTLPTAASGTQRPPLGRPKLCRSRAPRAAAAIVHRRRRDPVQWRAAGLVPNRWVQ